MENLLPLKARKWSTLLGGFLIHLSLGSFYTFGNMSPYLTSYLREYDGINLRYSDSIWIYTSTAITLSLSTVISGYLMSVFKLNTKLTIFIGCTLMSVGVFLTYFTLKVSFILTLLTYGILYGIGNGFAYLGPLSLAMKWFPNSSGFSNSCILLGFGAGSIIFDQIQTLYINPQNFSPDKPYSPQYPDEKYFSKLNIDLLNRIPKSCLVLGAIYFILQIIGLCLLCENKEISNGDLDTDLVVNIDDDNLNEPLIKTNTTFEENSLGVRYEIVGEGMEVKEALYKPVFYLITLMLGFSSIGPSLIITYYKTFGQTFIADDKFLATVGSVSNIFNAVGRLFWGYLVDKLPFKICYLLMNTALIALLSTVYLTKYITFSPEAFYLIWICGVFFAQCGIFVLMPTITTKCFGQKHFTSIYGTMFLLGIPSSFLTGVLGNLNDKIGWFWLFIVGCGFSIISN